MRINLMSFRSHHSVADCERYVKFMPLRKGFAISM
jgi:hypothetical protein